MNDRLIQKLTQEIEALKRATTHAEYNKHLYAIEMMANIGQSKVVHTAPSYSQAEESPTGPHAGITTEELKMMGAKVVSSEQKIKTDDGFGNGDSIFDF
ncbi:YwdI family protein [Macrococcus armenti]|uniref:DUF5327 family protein n=1 Tax=Macrococcus armenti TaxID=2875764 RepID=UPI001CCB8362|nr:DUF5327 family protein [Macrococcus armenti]UBH22240.1 YwdI family protein [Macrococcus armenti]